MRMIIFSIVQTCPVLLLSKTFSVVVLVGHLDRARSLGSFSSITRERVSAAAYLRERSSAPRFQYCLQLEMTQPWTRFWSPLLGYQASIPSCTDCSFSRAISLAKLPAAI